MLESNLVFISYASPDLQRIRPVYDELVALGLTVWFDKVELRPGQVWDLEIRRALRRAAVIVFFVSKNSVDRRGYVQREAKLALDASEERLEDDVYIIPVILDNDVELPEWFARVQNIKISEDNAVSRIADSIKTQLAELTRSELQTEAESLITWSYSDHKSAWGGVPGYSAEFRLIHLASREFEGIGEITDLIKGELIGEVMSIRSECLNQNSSHFNLGQSFFQRTNIFSAACGAPFRVGRIISIQYTNDVYYAGAAHPNLYFNTYCFLLSPLVRLSKLEELFEEPETALVVIRKLVREELKKEQSEDKNEDTADLDPDWVDRGTEEWSDFKNFVISDNVLRLLFAPYQVAAYAMGAHVANIELKTLSRHFKKIIRSALDIY